MRGIWPVKDGLPVQSCRHHLIGRILIGTGREEQLITNAVRASERLRIRADLAMVPVVQLWMVSDRTSIVIHVWDGSDEMPVRHEADPDDESGRGLMLVESLGKDWGAYRETSGKVVWVVIGGMQDNP
jgi:hypothetical protein